MVLLWFLTETGTNCKTILRKICLSNCDFIKLIKLFVVTYKNSQCFSAKLMKFNAENLSNTV